MKVEPYLNFEGRCDEAIELYKSALGAKVTMLMRFKESPDQGPTGKFPPEMLEKVMHSSLQIGDSVVMATDGHSSGKPNFAGVSLSATVSSEAEAERVFAALSAGGKVTMPLTKTFFSSRFGMLSDRFGVAWMIMVH